MKRGGKKREEGKLKIKRGAEDGEKEFCHPAERSCSINIFIKMPLKEIRFLRIVESFS